MQPRFKSDTLETMGLQGFIDDRYYRYGGYIQLIQMLKDGESDSTIGRHFRRKSATIARWRSKWIIESEIS